MYSEIERNESVKGIVKRKFASLLSSFVWLSELDRLRFLRHLVQLDRKANAKTREKHDKTIQFLKDKRFGKRGTATTNIQNLSSHKLSATEKFVLNHGLNFSIPPVSIKREELFSEFESLAGQLKHHRPTSDEHQERLFARLYDTAHAYSGTPIDDGDFRMLKECSTAYKSIKRSDSLVVTKPDKGSGIVLLDKADYTAKMMTILSDTSKFKRLGPASTHDKTATMEGRFQRRFKALLDQDKLTSTEVSAIRPSGAQRPKMYGLPKMHKPGIPLRSILSMINSPQHKLAKWLARLLEPVQKEFSTHTICDSFSFAQLMKEMPPSKETFMCSFDIKVSLRTFRWRKPSLFVSNNFIIPIYPHRRSTVMSVWNYLSWQQLAFNLASTV